MNKCCSYNGPGHCARYKCAKREVACTNCNTLLHGHCSNWKVSRHQKVNQTTGWCCQKARKCNNIINANLNLQTIDLPKNSSQMVQQNLMSMHSQRELKECGNSTPKYCNSKNLPLSISKDNEKEIHYTSTSLQQMSKQLSQNEKSDEPVYQLPSFKPVSPPNFSWGTLDGAHFSELITQAYQKVVHWRRHSFQCHRALLGNGLSLSSPDYSKCMQKTPA